MGDDDKKGRREREVMGEYIYDDCEKERKEGGDDMEEMMCDEYPEMFMTDDDKMKKEKDGKEREERKKRREDRDMDEEDDKERGRKDKLKGMMEKDMVELKRSMRDLYQMKKEYGMYEKMKEYPEMKDKMEKYYDGEEMSEEDKKMMKDGMFGGDEET